MLVHHGLHLIATAGDELFDDFSLRKVFPVLLGHLGLHHFDL